MNISLHPFFIYFICVNIYTHAIVCLWRSETSLQELVLSFLHVDSGHPFESFRLADKHLLPMETHPCLFSPSFQKNETISLHKRDCIYHQGT